MAGRRFDIVITGGGIAGSSLAIALARGGLRVLLLEAEVRFRDRVRGEALLPWGVTEARRLGIQELLVQGGARALPYRDAYVAGERRSRRPLDQESSSAEPILTFGHAAVQEALIQAASGAGARVVRGSRLRSLQAGCNPLVHYELDGRLVSASARLVAGADGRSSRVRSLGGFQVERGASGLHTTGVALRGLVLESDAVAAAVHAQTRESAALLPQGAGRARAYLSLNPNASDARIRDLPGLVARLTAAGLPEAMFASVTAAGPLATFDGTPRWVEFPYRDGVALIGDAASTSDPAWGQGMSLALRDANVLASALLTETDPHEAAATYAAEHARYNAANRVASSLMTLAQFGDGPEARQLRSSSFWKHSSRRIKALHLEGPDIDLQDLLLPGALAAERPAIPATAGRTPAPAGARC